MNITNIFRKKVGRPLKKMDFSCIYKKYVILKQQELEREIKEILRELKKYTQNYSFEKLMMDFKHECIEDWEKILATVQYLLNKEKNVAERLENKRLVRKEISKDPAFRDYSRGKSDGSAFDFFFIQAYAKRNPHNYKKF